MINEDLKNYIEINIFPMYDKNDSGHRIEHIKYVIDRSFEIIRQNNLDLDADMAYVIASYHDIGHHIDAKNHEKVSAEMLMNDKNLLKFFDENEIIVMKEAIEDHRASSKSDARSIYGKLVSSADRNVDYKTTIKRIHSYTLKHYTDYDLNKMIDRAYNHIDTKFGTNGYAKMYFKDEKYEQFINDCRELLKDKERLRREYIEINKL